MGVTLNEAKTSIEEARKESFNFLGYTFGPHRYQKDGHCATSTVRRCPSRLSSSNWSGNSTSWTFWPKPPVRRGARFRNCGPFTGVICANWAVAMVLSEFGTGLSSA